MKKYLIVTLLIALLALSAGCLGTQRKHVQPRTVTKIATITAPPTTTTQQITVTRTRTTTVTATTQEYLTLTTARTATTTVTGRETSGSNTAPTTALYNSVTVIPVESGASVKWSGRTATLYLASSFWYVVDGLTQVLSIMNTEYYSYFNSVYSSMGLPPLGTGTNYFEYVPAIYTFSSMFKYDSMRASTIGIDDSSYFPHELLSKKSGICGDYAILYAAWYLAHGTNATIYMVDFENLTVGHAWFFNGFVGFENQYIGIDTDYLREYWFERYGPYTEYEVIISTNGSVEVHKSIYSTSRSLPINYFFSTLSYIATKTIVNNSTTTTLYETGFLDRENSIATVTETYVYYGYTREYTVYCGDGKATTTIGSSTITLPGSIYYYLPLPIPVADEYIFTHHSNTIIYNAAVLGEKSAFMSATVSNSTISAFLVFTDVPFTVTMIEHLTIVRE